MQPDTVIANSAIPQTWNRYSYAHNNPIRFTDPTGNWIETAFDIAMVAVDIAEISKNGLSWSNGAALAIDVASVILPGIPAVGGLAIKAAKAANAVDNAMDVAKIANKVDNLADTAKASENLADAATTCLPMNSFRADTDVETSEGARDISAIQIGDYVLAWNEAEGTLGYYKVTDAFHHTDEVVTEVILDGEWIETTPEHPFYVEGEGWTNAEDLRTGDEVRQADGTTGIVWLQWNIYKTQEMYNLTVDTAHTFFVGDGQWLVHNSCYNIKMDKIDWNSYPGHLAPKPNGQLQFLDGDEYDMARDLADTANDFLHKKFPSKYKGFDIHEIQPVKFGGNPVSVSNKMPITKPNHSIVSNWWMDLQRNIERSPGHYLELE